MWLACLLSENMYLLKSVFLRKKHVSSIPWLIGKEANRNVGYMGFENLKIDTS